MWMTFRRRSRDLPIEGDLKMVTKTQDELNEMRAEIAAGTLPPDAIKKYREEEDRNVFGHDAKKRRDGTYEEQGVGSAKNQSANSIAAYRKYCSHEPRFEENLARMERELAATNERRAAERGIDR
jgi:hypothetical protein